MPQRFNAGDRVTLRVPKTFSNPAQTLAAGSRGTVLLKMLDDLRYRIQFDDRTKMSIIMDPDLQRAS
jgi:hypothetical protein